jgi:hypothetical protein
MVTHMLIEKVYIDLLFSGTVASVVVAILAMQYWRRPGGLWLGLLTLAFAIWGGALAMEVISPAQAAKIQWSQIQYLGITFGPAFTFLFALELDRQTQFRRHRWLVALLAVPLLVLLMVFTNSYHGLIWSGFRMAEPLPGIFVLIYDKGAAFWLFFIYVNVLLVLGSLLLIKIALEMRHVFRRQRV